MNLDEIRESIVELDSKLTKKLIQKALEEKIEPLSVLNEGLVAGMKEVGDLFSRKEYFVPEVLVASEAFYAGFNIVSPLIKSYAGKKNSKIIIGVVEGDIHDIGKNIVKIMFEAYGYHVIDLGKDVPVKTFVEAVINEKPKVLALSSLMSTTMMKMKDVIIALEKNNIRDKLKVIVGGAPVNENFAEQIGADGYGEDAFSAVHLIDKFVSE